MLQLVLLLSIQLPSLAVDYDYDGDGKADVAVRRTSTQYWYIRNSGDDNFNSTRGDGIQRIQFGKQASDIPVPADYDGDGITDIAVRRPGNFYWYIKNSSGSNYNSDNEDGIQRIRFGTKEEDVPVPADYDGDGKADVAVRRPSSSFWYIKNSGGSNYNSDREDGIQRVRFGTQTEDIPVKGDFNGDGIADIAVRRPSTFFWYILNSQGEQQDYNAPLGDRIQRVQFGKQVTDIPVPADYDGDGITDIAVRRPANFTWYILRSSDNEIERIVFGKNVDDIPVPADYDGDGKADVAVRRASEQMFYIKNSSNGDLQRVQFGSQQTDIPVNTTTQEVLNMLQQGDSSSEPNNNPTIDAGQDIEVTEGDSVELIADASDPDGDQLSYTWTQTSGDTIALDNTQQATISFIAPEVIDTQSFVFTVQVSDGNGGSATDSVTVTVNQAAVTVEVDALPVVYVQTGTEYRYRPDFGDWNSASGVSFSVENLPHWAQFDTDSGEISGIAALDELTLEPRFFDISITANKDNVSQTIGPFNIILLTQDAKISGNLLTLVTRYPDTLSAVDQAAVAESYERMASYLDVLSHGRQEANFDIQFIDPIGATLANIRTWAETSTFLSLAYYEISPGSIENCVVSDVIETAQRIFEEQIDTYRSYYGYQLEALDTTYAESLTDSNACIDTAAGDIALTFISLPADLVVSEYDALIFHIYDDDYNSGGFQGYLTEANGVTQGTEMVINKTFLVSGATNFNMSQLQRYPDFEEAVHADYYTAGQVELTSFEQQTSHEVIHALGLGTHDCGFDYYASIDFNNIETLLLGDNFSNYSYGDWFSSMGAAHYSLDVAPASKEYLGWVSSNEINTIINDTQNIVIGDAYSIEQIPYAKVLTNSGWLYVSYYTGQSFGESLLHPNLSANLEGIQIRYTEFRDLEIYKTLTTSTLLDPNQDLSDHDYSLKSGELLELYNVVIENISVNGSTASFDIRYTDSN